MLVRLPSNPWMDTPSWNGTGNQGRRALGKLHVAGSRPLTKPERRDATIRINTGWPTTKHKTRHLLQWITRDCVPTVTLRNNNSCATHVLLLHLHCAENLVTNSVGSESLAQGSEYHHYMPATALHVKMSLPGNDME